MWFGTWIVIFMTLINFWVNDARSEEILVKGVPYIAQKAHID